MSTTVVVKKGNEIVIGADSLTIYGSTKIKSHMVKNYSKIFKLGDTYIATCGNAASKQVLMNYFSKFEELPEFDSVENIFDVFVALHKSLKEDYYLRPEGNEDDDYECSHVQCLLANKTGIYGVDDYRYVEEYTKYYAYGAGYKFALGAMHAVYDNDLSADEIALIGLKAAAEFDDMTNEPFEIYKILINS